MVRVYKNASMEDQIIRRGPQVEEEYERLGMFLSIMGEHPWDPMAKASGSDYVDKT